MYCPEFLRQYTRQTCILILTLLLAACGGGGGGGGGSSTPAAITVTGSTIPGANVMPVKVNAGISQFVNRLYATVTVCKPGSTSTCATIDNILVDTGSVGLRLMSSSAITALGLSPQQASDGNPLMSCAQFLDGSYVWGSTRLADVTLGQLTASSIPVQIIADSNITAPATCSSNGSGTDMNTAAALGANGMLGIGFQSADCGNYCASISGIGYYYTCPGGTGTCNPIKASTSIQLQNPVPHFPTDNNGITIVLPAVPATGAASIANGSILFGVGSQSNNQLGSSTVLQVSSSNYDYLSTSVASTTAGVTYNNPSMGSSFLDTGSNGLYFGTSAMTACTGSAAGFYCPSGKVNFSATLRGTNGTSAPVSFAADNAVSEFSSGNYALPLLTGQGSNSGFDWGLPFYFGRTVFQCFEGASASNGNTTISGPFYAF